MSNPPPLQPQPPISLNYAAPMARPRRNRWWMVLLRVVGGALAGIFGMWMGWALAATTNIPALFMVPPGLLLAGAILVVVKYRRFGYITGLVIAPFIVAAIIFAIIVVVLSQHHP